MNRKTLLVGLLVALIAGAVSIPIFFFATSDDTPDVVLRPEPIFDPSDARQASGSRPRRLPPKAPCAPIHFGFEGNPRKYRGQGLGRYKVPDGRTWNIANTSVMMERHHGGPYAAAGEWTGVVGVITDTGRTSIAISSLDNGSGIALQGQGRTNVDLASGDVLTFNIWLRPYTSDGSGRVATDRTNYYYTVSASGLDCPA